MNIFDLEACIGLDTSEYEKGIKDADREMNNAKKSLSDYRKDVMNLAQQYKNSGMDMSSAMKKAYADIDKSEYDMGQSHQKAGKETNSLRDKIKDLVSQIGVAGGEFDGFSDKLKNGAEKIKNVAETIVKVGTVAVGAAATGISAITKMSLESYASYEQLVGGVDTLFKESSQKVQEYADNAYKTAGLSANEYMETVTSFSASLLQGLDGDTELAADIANMAITDMADNANKMGTDMESIQNAYQGFAKQNYTMLDNLKLGYGGTQAEMARLINDSGVLGDTMTVTANNLNEVSFDKMIEAIHVVQTEMGITGTTSEEAASTIEGSVNSMKSSWKNLLVEIGKDNGDIEGSVDELVQSVKTAGSNILPRIEKILNGIGDLVEELLPEIAEKIPEILTDVAPKLISTATRLVMVFVNAAASELPESIPKIWNSLSNLGSELYNNVIKPAWEFVTKKLPTLINDGIKKLDTGKIGKTISDLLLTVFEGASNFLDEIDWTALGEKIAEFLNEIDWLGIIKQIFSLIGELIKGAPELLKGVFENIDAETEAEIVGILFGKKLVSSIASTLLGGEGVKENFANIKSALSSNITAGANEGGVSFGTKFTAGLQAFILGWSLGSLIYDHFQKEIDGVLHPFFDAWLSGIDVLGEKWSTFKENWKIGADAIKDAVQKVKDKWNEFKDNWALGAETIHDKITEIKEWFTGIGDKIKEIGSNALEWGKDLIQNFIDGIKSKWEDLKSNVSSVAQTVKDFIGFSEPKKGPLSNFHTYAPDMIDLFTEGIHQNKYLIENEVSNLAENIKSGFETPIETSFTASGAVNTSSGNYSNSASSNSFVFYLADNAGNIFAKTAQNPLDIMNGQKVELAERGYAGI